MKISLHSSELNVVGFSLCNLEKFYIISKPELASLNQRNELAKSSRHRKKPINFAITSLYYNILITTHSINSITQS